jgi:hypothetical protein
VLVTDSADERSWFEETYPGRLLYSTRVFDRRTVVGMQHAMTDFLALTSCKRIVGSVGSSFGELAALYGDTPFRAAASFSNP